MNVQNLPRDFKAVKQAFRPKLDAFLFFDYKNIEPRMFAYFLSLMGDDSYAENFRIGNDDPYLWIAEKMWPGQEISSLRRQMAKRIFLSTLYGAGYKKIQVTLIQETKEHWTFTQARAIVQQMHRAVPGIRKLSDAAAQQAESKGYLRTPWGRHLHPDSPHKALNYIIQGSAADLMKWATLEVYDKLNAAGYTSHIVNIIHDELMLDVLEDEVPDLVRWIPEKMIYLPVHEIVPIKADIEISRGTWADKEDYA